jgi:hypothetical protein
MDQSARFGPASQQTQPSDGMADKFVIDVITRHQQAVDRYLAPFYAKTHLQYVGKATMDEDGGIKTSLLGRDSNEAGDGYLQEPILYQLMDTLTATVTPPTPAVEILPQSLEISMSAAQTAQALINNAFRRRRLTGDLGRAVTYTGLFGHAYMLTTWSEDETLPRYDVIHPKDLFVDPIAKKWEDVRYVVHRVILPAEEVRLRGAQGTYTQDAVERVLKGATPASSSSLYATARYYLDEINFGFHPPTEMTLSDEATRFEQSLENVCLLYQVYDFVNNEVIHVAAQYRGSAKEVVFREALPYKLVRNPFSMLRFTDSLDSLRGVSIAQLVTPLVDQLHKLKTMRMRHAAAMIPRTLMRADIVQNPDAVQTAILNAPTPGHTIPVSMAGSGTQHIPLEALFWSTPTPAMPPDYDKTLKDLEDAIYATAGISPFQRGQIGESRVATELALADASNQTRQGRIFQAVGFLIEDLARKTLDLYAEFLAENKLALRIGSRIQEIQAEQLPFIPGVSTVGTVDISVTPYSPQEQTRAVLAQKVMTFLPALQGINPQSLDTQKVQEYLLAVAGLPHNLVKTLEQQAEEAEAMAMAAENEAAAQAGSVNAASGGGLPISPGVVTKGGDTQATQAAGSPRAQGSMVGGAGKRR